MLLILKTHEVVKSTGMSNLRFSSNGFLSLFTYKGIEYCFCDYDDFFKEDLKTSNRKIPGYYELSKYQEYMKQNGNVNYYDLYKYNFTYKYAFETVENESNNDSIVTEVIELKDNITEGFEIVRYVWFYEYDVQLFGRDSNGFPSEIIIPYDIVTSRTVIGLDLGNEAESFYALNIPDITSPSFIEDKNKAARKLAIATLNVDRIIRDVYPIFTSNSELLDWHQQQILYWTTQKISNNLDTRKLDVFCSAINNYADEMFAYQFFINEVTDNDEKLYISCLGLGTLALSVVSKDFRFKMLIKSLNILKDVGVPDKEKEVLVVNILGSFIYNDISFINEVLDFLQKSYVVDINQSSSPAFDLFDKTNYEMFYSKLSAPWFSENISLSQNNPSFYEGWDTSDTKALFVKIVYILWLHSKYNPYHFGGVSEGELKEESIAIRSTTLGLTTYEVGVENGFIVTSPVKPNAIHFYTTYENTYEIINHGNDGDEFIQKRKDASPIVLNYESDKFFGFYIDFFTFKFNRNSIEVYEELKDKLLFSKGVEGSNTYIEHPVFLRGTYGLFQPVQLINNKPDTKIPVPLISGNDFNVGKTNINSLIPVFVLHHLDTVGDESDFYNAIGLVTDIITTATGIGNLTKLRHLRHLSKFVRAQRLIAGLEVTSGVMSFISDYIISDCDTEFCQLLRTFSNFLELASLSADSIYSIRRLNRSAKAINDYTESHGGFPNDFDNLDAHYLIYTLSNLDVSDYNNKFIKRARKKLLDQIKSENAFREAVKESATLELIYNDQQINELLQKAIDKNVSIEDGMGIIFQGCRIRRDGIQIPFNTLLLRVDNMATVRKRRYPFTFATKTAFDDYAHEKVFLAVELFGMKRDRVYYTGSSLVSTTSVGDGAFDTDWAVEYSPSEMMEYANEMKNRWSECKELLESGATIKSGSKKITIGDAKKKEKDIKDFFEKHKRLHKRYIIHVRPIGLDDNDNPIYELLTLEDHLKSFPISIKTDLTPVTIGYNEAYPKIKYTFFQSF